MIPQLPHCQPAHGPTVKMNLKDSFKPDILDSDIWTEEIDRFYNEGGNLPPVLENSKPARTDVRPENGHRDNRN